jgi:hypothetical protein
MQIKLNEIRRLHDMSAPLEVPGEHIGVHVFPTARKPVYATIPRIYEPILVLTV